MTETKDSQTPVNDPRTQVDADTNVTQARSGFDLEDTRRQLIALRKAYGADTPMGHACSNVVEQLGALQTYDRPVWATDERQTLPYLIGKQMERIAKLKGANH